MTQASTLKSIPNANSTKRGTVIVKVKSTHVRTTTRLQLRPPPRTQRAVPRSTNAMAVFGAIGISPGMTAVRAREPVSQPTKAVAPIAMTARPQVRAISLWREKFKRRLTPGMTPEDHTTELERRFQTLFESRFG